MKRIGNSILNKAKYSNNTDEWYTDYKTIEKEVIHYKSQLNGKKYYVIVMILMSQLLQNIL